MTWADQQARQLDELIARYEQALQEQPARAELLGELGATLAQRGRFPEAVVRLEEALRLRPDFPEARNNLGNVFKELQQLANAEANYREALRLRPDFPEAHNNLAATLADQRKFEEAEQHYGAALRCQPDYADAHHNLGHLLRQMGRLPEAEACYRQALRLRPDLPPNHNHLGAVLAEQGRYPEALVLYQEAIRLWPAYGEAYLNVGLALARLARHDDARACLEHSLQLQPHSGQTLNALATLYLEQGLAEEAILCLRRAVAAEPDNASLHSKLLLALHYPADYDPQTTFAEHLRWASRFAVASPAHQSRLERHGPEAESTRDPDRQLRIGYVSGDFREHVMGRYLEALLDAHDQDRYEVFCYSTLHEQDFRTARMKALASQWRCIAELSDDQAAEQIVQDRIDLLIDLAGHTNGNRPGVFARKPAPIQVTHCGYPDTTGLSAIDYRLMDFHTDPPGRTESLHTEQLVRLPESHWCYAPPTSLEVSPLPAAKAGVVAFGSLNNPAKVTERMIGVWSQILSGLPDARMVVQTGVGRAGHQRVRDAFQQHGIGPERLRLLEPQKSDEYFRLLQTIDICLDTYPYTGCNTTADALWMGVPVVTLAGPTCVTRLGISALVLAGLGELVTESPTAYVAAAARLAQDLPRLQQLRASLRQRVASTLGDVPRFTRQLEAVYRALWTAYCRQQRV